MKRTFNFFSLLLVLSLLLLPTQTVAASGPYDGPVIFGGTFTLEDGETQNGDVVVFGGVVDIEDGAVVNGSIVVFGGSLTIDGQVNGEVVLMGGAAMLGETALINGDLSLVSATLNRADGSQVNGDINYNVPNAHTVDAPFVVVPAVPGMPDDLPFIRPVPLFSVDNPLWKGLSIFGRSLGMAMLALLVALFLEEPTRRVGEAVTGQPVVAGGLGFLAIPVTVVAVLILAVTIILAPVAFLLVLVFLAGLLYGWIALGFEVGQRFTKMIGQEWALPVTAAFGTWLLTLISASLNLVPCVGWMAPFIIVTLALGGVVMSRFGSRPAMPLAAAIVASPAPAESEPLPSVDGDGADEE